MLIELHVKNLALIERADLEFDNGLTILSGETGAGKSILIDSINVALGAKVGKGIIRNGAEYAYIELVFAVCDPEKIEKIRQMEIEVEDNGLLIITRKITPVKSVAKINDETVTSAKLRKLTEILIDMHGQFEHQSLLSPSSHLEYIDKLSPDEIRTLKASIAENCSKYNGIIEILSDGDDSALREREADILRYETEEIEKAELKEGEEEELLAEFRRMKNSSKLAELLGKASDDLDSDVTGHAAKNLIEAAGYDDSLESIRQQVSEIEDLITDARRGIDEYMESLNYDAERFDEIENRLDTIHRIQGKYGDDISGILSVLEEKKERLDYLENYDSNREKLIQKREELEKLLSTECETLSTIRKNTAAVLKDRIVKQLEDLNFLGVDFDIEFRTTDRFTSCGTDAVQFLISTNPGQPLKPLKDVASGGELSRIMLALKTVLADTDEIETLIFDEIDAGISGRTAQKVAEKLSVIGRDHQVLCITHLPQIAAMADHHYLISKSTDGSSTRTEIRNIEGEEIIEELARMLGGTEITGSVIDAAREMKEMAKR